MSNKKSKTSVADLMPPKKYSYETSVSDLIKSQKKNSYVTSVADLIKPKKKYLYVCDCVRCDGTEVDSRTLEKHVKDESLWKSEDARKKQENTIKGRKQKKSSIIIQGETSPNISKKRKRDSHQNNEEENSPPNPDSFQPNNEEENSPLNPDSFQPNNEENIPILFSSKPSSHFHIPAPTIDESNIDDYFGVDQEGENEDENNIQEGENEDEDNIQEGENEDEDNIKDFFATPEIDCDEEFVMESLNDSIETEIIIWIFKFQQRFRLPDMALEALIKFLRIIITRLNKSQFENFPKSLYMAKKMLNIIQPKMQLAVCTNCHKLHNVNEIIAYKEEGKVAIMNCLYEEFADNPIINRRNKCNNPLSTLKKNKNEVIAVPRMLYPRPSIRQQLSMLYQRPGFEDMLRMSGSQRSSPNAYSDIYDGRVWQTFPFDGSKFFTTETAVIHLGLLFNLDWFQPFTYTQHSTGALYASICNLPRSERNKPENIIYLGFLPGPKEVGLERINHYLAPIVNEFLELWKGWRVPKTNQCPDGLDIKVALIVGSSDIPATRKLFGHDLQ